MGFRFGGFTVFFDFSFFAMLGAFLSLEHSGRNMGHIFPALLIHELGHLAAAFIVHIPIDRMCFSCFGIELVRKQGISSAGWRQEAFVYLAGPMINLCCAAGFLCLPGNFETAAAVHLVLGLFQLLPVGVLDGGCIADVILEHFFESGKAAFWGLVLSIAALIPLAIAGWALMRGEQRNFTLLLCCAFLMLSIWKK
jgi:stage IV sporulation protein FB